MRLIFHGHSCFSIMTDRYHIIIDPFITGNPKAEIKVDEIKPTHILLTHGHQDHLGDAIHLSKKSKALIIAPNELGLYCEFKGALVHRMHIGGSRNFEFGWVKLTPAWHGSAVVENNTIIYTGTPCGYVIRIEDKYLYHAGDTGLFGDMSLIGDSYDLTCAMIPIGDNYVMGPEDAIKAAEMLNPKIVIPMHYNTFPEIEQDPEDFAQRTNAILAENRVRVLSPGDYISI